jgi:hypothetical protein
MVNPTSTPAGSFAGEVVALELNTDFAVPGFLPGGAAFGDLTVCGVSGLPAVTVNAFLQIVNAVLGGGSSGLSRSLLDVAVVTQAITNSFVAGSPATFAQDHLVSGACP